MASDSDEFGSFLVGFIIKAGGDDAWGLLERAGFMRRHEAAKSKHWFISAPLN